MTGTNRHIEVNIAEQRLRLFDQDKVLMDIAVSTASNGAGELFGSECTPRGQHVIRARIGADCQPGTVFVARRPTGEIYTPELKQTSPERDWILTRILWLSGTERGKNRLGNVDTMRRFIYIHGAPDEDLMGVPSSHGCVKMRNSDVIQLFDQVEAGIPVNILER
ncbi:MAG: L,D-transpeptidase [Gammaproteobacteria bacterium]|nr:L,D-transpeptidase [Gammaproteobacteria bacterium]